MSKEVFVPIEEWGTLTLWKDHPSAAIEAVAAPPNYAKEIQLYTEWNEWLVAGAGLVRTVAQVLEKELSPGKALTAVNAACHTFYSAAQGMNKGILSGIADMKQGKAPVVEFDPTQLPTWPIDSKPDLFSSAWDTLKPLLVKLDTALSAKYPGNPIIVGLGGLVNAGDEIIAALKAYYPAWGGG